MDHPNIVKLFEVFEEQDNIYLVLEYIQGINMLKALINRPKFSEDWIRCLMLSIFKTIQYLEANNIIHRDLKFENILFMFYD